MTVLQSVLLLCTVLLASEWLTGRFRRFALERRLLDVPNERSSHAVATARGGGVGAAVIVLAALPVLGWSGAMTWSSVWGLGGGGALVTIIGYVDDQQHVPARWRLLGHFAAAAWVLAWMGGFPPVRALGVSLPEGWIGNSIAVLYLVWLLNLTNFMDGLDGIVGVEVVTVSVGGALLYLVAVPGLSPWLTPLVVASATGGFLIWNWPPAKIFMGDSGSGFLGLMLAALSLQAGWVAPALFWSWLIMLGVFVVDATVTLVRRVARGEQFYVAHRNHAYQHAARQWGAHRPVTLAIGGINLCWLLPIALAVALGRLDGLLGVLIAYAPLVVAAVRLKAGSPSIA